MSTVTATHERQLLDPPPAEVKAIYDYQPPAAVLGRQANLWTEYAATPSRAEYDIPRTEVCTSLDRLSRPVTVFPGMLSGWMRT